MISVHLNIFQYCIKNYFKRKLSVPTTGDEAWEPFLKEFDEVGLGLAGHAVFDHITPNPLEQRTKTLHLCAHAFLNDQVYL